MSTLPSISTFTHQVDQCINDIRRCVESCEEIRRERRLGRNRRTTALDQLETSLQSGSGFILGEASRYPRLSTADPDITCAVGGSTFTGYIMEIEEINVSLQAIAHPSHHYHHYHHTHLSHVLFPGWDYDAHHHSHEEHPHFNELREKWERIRDAIPRAFADMDLQAAWKEKARIKREEEDTKIKEDKKKSKDKLDKIEEANKEELERFEKRNEKQLEKLEKHNEEQLEAHEKIEHKRDLAVEKLVENTLEDDPIEKIDKLAHVMGHLSRAITPRASHERIPLHVSLNTSAQASGAGYGRGGRGGNANPEVVVHDDGYHHE
ncbi:hypothetical protein NA56DRAFT_754994 [Hyaloscypha hepaticicola]|uniref:Uncharacterized protein n=1 Tax=Hyaloscypha hepaticicola TaxID=2082293 RepID=A0A2J6PJT4_9HELO|nr:hypothetical protein NA56DRAFT_754994 [Hyaloscypha hepaticicola]